jgi:4-amino-4-deoxy-L-arabinose transferase-like glycosyltransferase
MIHKSQNGISIRDHLYWNLVNVFCWSIALQIGLISFLCQIVAILIYSNFKNQMKYFGISLVVFGSIAGTWTTYKNGVLASTQNIQSGWNSNVDNAFTSGEKLLIPLNGDIFKNAFKSSLNLTGLNSLFNREIESKGILKNVFEGCAVWYPTENTYIAGQIQNSITTNCKAKELSAVFLGLVPLGAFLWQISNIFLWIVIAKLLFFYRNKNRLILLPTVLLFLSYTVLIFSIDRYILPTYLVPLILLTKMINSLVQKFSLVLRSNSKS